ncbi:hypothetical protein ABZ746_30000 [Streptomyces sp. NPDC020096]
MAIRLIYRLGCQIFWRLALLARSDTAKDIAILTLRHKVAASTVWEILEKVGIDPATQRCDRSWGTFLTRPGPGSFSRPEVRHAECPWLGWPSPRRVLGSIPTCATPGEFA